MHTSSRGAHSGPVQFPANIRVPIKNHLTSQRYWLISGDQIEATDKRLAEISAICNEPEIYNWLFRSSFSDAPYTGDNAREWITWTAEGWQNSSHFSFAVTDDTGAIAAACDIKTADLREAEVGYWASLHHRGIMTNAVIGLCILARQAGFQALFARTDPKNSRSQAVLKRAGFVHQPLRGDAANDFFGIDL